MNEPPDEPADPRLAMVSGVVLAGVMIGAAVLWLSVRGRLEALPEQAVGRHGALLAAGVGLLTGVAAATVAAFLSLRCRGLRELEEMMTVVLGRTGESGVMLLVIASALAEELFFRMAVQDQFGLAGSVIACVVLYGLVGNGRLLPFVFLHALTLGLVVHLGFGLLGSTTAHAIMNHLSIRRVRCR